MKEALLFVVNLGLSEQEKAKRERVIMRIWGDRGAIERACIAH